MIALVRVELTRLRWRRAVLLLLAAAVVVPGVMFAFLVHNTRPRGPVVSGDLYYQDYRPVLDLVGERTGGSALAVGILLALVAVLVGTTFAGHDWNTGSMSNQLLFEPRRERVWLAKSAAVALASATFAFVVHALYWTALWVVANRRDLTVPEHAMSAAYKQSVLVAILAAGAGVFGFALTMLLRSTVGTLGLLFALSVGGAALLVAIGFHHESLLPTNNILAFLVGTQRIVDYDCYDATDGCTTVVTRADASLYLAAIVAALAAVSLLSFRSRDVP